MKEVILYVYASYDEGHLFVSVEPLTDFGDFKGRMIGIKTDLPYSASYTELAKEGDVVADVGGKAWLVVELCDSAMKSFADSEPSAPFEKMGRFEVNIGG